MAKLRHLFFSGNLLEMKILKVNENMRETKREKNAIKTVMTYE